MTPLRRICAITASLTRYFAMRLLIWAMICTALPAAAQSTMVDATLLDSPDAFPADLGFLNHRPAGVLGRVRANGEMLEFGDGTPARFWGVNIQANALFGTKDADIVRHAKGLARMGVNLVRLHHHDSDWVRTNIFGTRAQSTTQLDPNAIARLDAWIAALRAEGIYIWLDLHVGRVLAPMDRVAHGDELRESRHEGDLRGYNFVNADIAALMGRFTAQYLGHINPQTGLSYARDPAIAVVQISNENDLVKHFANRLLSGKGTPSHAALFTAEAKKFANERGLNARDITRGRSTMTAALFASDLEHRFFARMTRTIRDIGYEGLLTTSSFWGGMPLAGLSSLSAGDMIDVHSYAKPGEMFGAAPADNPKAGTMLSRIAGAQVAGLPLSVSEWNMGGFPARDRYAAPVRIAAMAAFQQWDALMLYGYAQRSLSLSARPGAWNATTDPALMAGLPVGALLYRAGHVRPAETVYIFAPQVQDLYGTALSANTVPALRDIPERAGLRVALPKVAELPWLHPRGDQPYDPVSRFSNPQARPLDPASPVVSDTGEIQHDFGKQILIIDTPQSQLVMGRSGGAPQRLSGMEVAVSNEESLVAVQSLGPEPITRSRALLVSLVLPSELAQARRLPFVSEPATGVIVFTAPQEMILRDVAPARARNLISHTVSGTRHKVTVTGAPGALWLTFESPAEAAPVKSD